jgi:5-methylthioadenosine/S-adenosylhomocysteine deaminase
MVSDADLALVGGYVLTQGSDGMIPDGVVAIRGDRITAVGPRDTLRSVNAERTIDCTGKLVLPGLVDCHVHTCQQLSRGLADEVDADEWMRRIVWFEAVMTEEDVGASARAACLEMIKAGTTSFVEACANPLYVDAVGEAIHDSGLRGILTRSTIEKSEGSWNWSLPGPLIMDAAENLAATRRMIEKWNGSANGRILAWCGWRHLANLSDQLIRNLVGLAREYGVGLHGHVGVQDYGETTYLDDLGLLGPDLLFAHGFRTTGRDVELIAHYDVKISHNPSASAHGAYGAAVVGRIPEMLDRGVCVCLGSDSAAGGNKLDVLRQASLAAVLHKEARQDAKAVSARTALQMATTNGARAIGWRDVGFLASGAKADIAVVDASQPHLMPFHNLTNNLVYSGSGQDVITTIVDGRVLMEDRQVLVMDEVEVMREASERAREIAGRWRERLAIEYPGTEART